MTFFDAKRKIELNLEFLTFTKIIDANMFL